MRLGSLYWNIQIPLHSLIPHFSHFMYTLPQTPSTLWHFVRSRCLERVFNRFIEQIANKQVKMGDSILKCRKSKQQGFFSLKKLKMFP